MTNDKQQKYQKSLMIVIFTVFALIAVGGLVRSTGSGMGCPDWPKCFGQYIPPTDISELPADYKEKFAVAGRVIADFSPVKTWIEYINRLFGVWTGIAVLILSYFSFAYRKAQPRVFWGSQLALFLVILNGWLGSKVVATHLKPGVITAHMILAILLIFVLQHLKHISIKLERVQSVPNLKKYKNLMWLMLILTFVQVVLGTQVREQIDHITNNDPNLARSNWVGRLDYIFFIHRSFSAALLIGIVVTLKKLMEAYKDSIVIQKLCISIALVLFGEIAGGVILAYFSFPAIVQPIHLLLSVFLMSYMYELIVVLSKAQSEPA
jgi:cytochrome c oxidase assembly protein subunit 15